MPSVKSPTPSSATPTLAKVGSESSGSGGDADEQPIDYTGGLG